MKNTFDSHFREKAKEIKIKPSQHVWENINTEISKPKQYSISSFISIAAAIILLIGAASILWLQSHRQEYRAEYRVEQLDVDVEQTYHTALMNWISESHY